jgi:hypothetical protein
MTDIIERLRSEDTNADDCFRAANEIERLRAALEQIKYGSGEAWAANIARTALENDS